jgi:hypothetical protein
MNNNYQETGELMYKVPRSIQDAILL